VVALSSLLVTAAFLPGFGCTGVSYEDAKAKAAEASVLISPDTLDAWIDRGYGTDSFGFDRMVALDVSTTAEYVTGHVKGAFHLDSAADLSVSRSDGIDGTYTYSYTDATSGNTITLSDINAMSNVATSEMMNAVIRKTGIDRNTVVVLTGNSLLNVARAYFNLRYWGFPKERIRVLDRTKPAYVTAGHALDTTIPAAPSLSSYSVCDLTPNTSLRATLPDMIRLAEGSMANAIAWDVRNLGEYDGTAGATAGPFQGKTAGATPETQYSKKVAFEGHVRGAVNLAYTALLGDTNTRFLDADTIKAALREKGITKDIRTHAY
jgi:3-mercaptopyruvate sulfurtransferase SseA